MLRQATIPATRNDNPVRLTVLHNGDYDGEGGRDYVQLQVNGGQPVEVNADDLRAAIADVLPKEEA